MFVDDIYMSEVTTDMQPTQTKPADIHPVFREYDESQIARAGGYAVGTVLNVKSGSARLTKSFRLRVSGGLRRPEYELFAPVAEGNEQ